MNDAWDIVDLPKAISSRYGWPSHQIDISNAFLHGFLDDDIYMSAYFAPNGYPITQEKISKLKRSLYGLKQASRQMEFGTYR
ncbi:UNVERIFIED_CONTAM: Retrovirus-related Pol polyprotein from transposon RE1 [Sesamum calycinum]|uniref:Retrovirus-related Pol polyprotein from transposon RE1 n=1 Tax=Sesamum calycinum TaxID=2727403 RepID=A0AAW2R768_9LAMI